MRSIRKVGSQEPYHPVLAQEARHRERHPPCGRRRVKGASDRTRIPAPGLVRSLGDSCGAPTRQAPSTYKYLRLPWSQAAPLTPDSWWTPRSPSQGAPDTGFMLLALVSSVAPGDFCGPRLLAGSYKPRLPGRPSTSLTTTDRLSKAHVLMLMTVFLCMKKTKY